MLAAVAFWRAAGGMSIVEGGGAWAASLGWVGFASPIALASEVNPRLALRAFFCVRVFVYSVANCIDAFFGEIARSSGVSRGSF